MRTLVALGWAGLVLHACLRRLGRREPAVPRTPRRPGVPGADVAFTADLLAVAITGGLTPLLAIQAASTSSPPSVAVHLQAVRTAVGSGQRLLHALEAGAAAIPELGALFGLLATSERTGAPVGPLLTGLAAEERARARRAALVRARKLPVRLLFPLVFLLFPAFLVLTVAPALIAGLR
jgi:tight adherence protein C